MVDSFSLGTLFITIIGILFSVRIASFRKDILEMLEDIKREKNKIYEDFASKLKGWKKGYFDPQQLIDYSARYCTKLTLAEKLEKSYKSNKRNIIIDLVSILIIIITIFIYSYTEGDNIDYYYIIKITSFVTSSFLFIFSCLTFGKSIKILHYDVERELGIGKADSNT